MWTSFVNTGGRRKVAEGGSRRQLTLRENATEGLHYKCSFLRSPTYIYLILYIYVYIYIYIYTYAYMYVHIDIYLCILINVYVCVFACVNTPQYTHNFIHLKKCHLNWQPESIIVSITNFYNWNLAVMYVCIYICMSCMVNMRRCTVDWICVQRERERERERGRDWKRGRDR
jgi:hypothetical protein